MKLYILRHGQAEPLVADDYSRQLTAKGRSDVKALARKLSAQGIIFDRAIVSPFVRTIQTFESLCEGFDRNIPVKYSDLLLSETPAQATTDYLTNELAGAGLECVLLVSHQPLVSSLISNLIHASTKESFNYPMSPASLTVLSMELPAAKMAQLSGQFHPPYES